MSRSLFRLPIPSARASILLGLLAVIGSPGAASSQASIPQSLDLLWSAADSVQSERAVTDLLALELPFDSLIQLARAGPRYGGTVETGTLQHTRQPDSGAEFHYTLVVPRSYDPGRRYAVRVHLHGGVEREGKRRGGAWEHERYSGADWIAVFPSGWRDAMWWFGNQVENVGQILMEIKRTYNLDENRIYLLGVSDGGTGTYFYGMKAATPWAGILPLLGHPSVLANPRVRADGQLYVVNLRSVSLLVASGEVDPLYPAHRVAPYVTLFREAGIETSFRVLENVGHNMSWWEAESDTVSAFMRDHPRDPLPDSVTWETERVDRYNRARWVLVTELGPASGEVTFPSFNSVAAPLPRPALGVGVVEVPGGGGVELTRVNEGSVAETAGLRVGDVILAVEGVDTPTEASLIAEVRDVSFGSRIVVTVDRAGARVPVAVTYPPPPPPEPPFLVFPHPLPSGRIEVVRRGNTIHVRTRGVRAYRLLLSPDEFDLSRPVTVRTNDRDSFHGVVPKDPATLLRWVSRDRDRTMLFAAELEIRLPEAGE